MIIINFDPIIGGGVSTFFSKGSLTSSQYLLNIRLFSQIMNVSELTHELMMMVITHLQNGKL